MSSSTKAPPRRRPRGRGPSGRGGLEAARAQDEEPFLQERDVRGPGSIVVAFHRDIDLQEAYPHPPAVGATLDIEVTNERPAVGEEDLDRRAHRDRGCRS